MVPGAQFTPLEANGDVVGLGPWLLHKPQTPDDITMTRTSEIRINEEWSMTRTKNQQPSPFSEQQERGLK